MHEAALTQRESGPERSASCQPRPHQELAPAGTQGPVGVTHLRGSAICERRTNGRDKLPLHFVLLPDANSPGCRVLRPPPPPPAATPAQPRAVSSPRLQGRTGTVRVAPQWGNLSCKVEDPGSLCSSWVQAEKQTAN